MLFYSLMRSLDTEVQNSLRVVHQRAAELGRRAFNVFPELRDQPNRTIVFHPHAGRELRIDFQSDIVGLDHPRGLAYAHLVTYPRLKILEKIGLSLWPLPKEVRLRIYRDRHPLEEYCAEFSWEPGRRFLNAADYSESGPIINRLRDELTRPGGFVSASALMVPSEAPTFFSSQYSLPKDYLVKRHIY